MEGARGQNSWSAPFPYASPGARWASALLGMTQSLLEALPLLGRREAEGGLATAPRGLSHREVPAPEALPRAPPTPRSALGSTSAPSPAPHLLSPVQGREGGGED